MATTTTDLRRSMTSTEGFGEAAERYRGHQREAGRNRQEDRQRRTRRLREDGRQLVKYRQQLAEATQLDWVTTVVKAQNDSGISGARRSSRSSGRTRTSRCCRTGDWSELRQRREVESPRRRDARRGEEPAHALRAGVPQSSYPSFKVLRESYGQAGPALPGRHSVAPIDLAIYAFGEAAFGRPVDPRGLAAGLDGPRHRRDPRREAGDDVVFQLETVVALIAIAQAGRRGAGRPSRARWPRRCWGARSGGHPQGARFGIHLCLGDFHHTAYGEGARRPPARAARERDRGRVPRRTRCSIYVHAPFAAAKEPPIAAESFYEPLRDLGSARRHPVHRRVPARLARHRGPTATSSRASRVWSGREVDVAAACGLGRREEATRRRSRQMRETAALLQEPATA